jgi:lipopolysaccharide/colanic/teichoic acid biosynthesis glycosyltransferase
MWNLRRLKPRNGSKSQARTALDGYLNPVLITQTAFVELLHLEQKRTERSHRPFVLMLLDCGSFRTAASSKEDFEKLLGALSRSTRETDVKGWYQDGFVVGVIFTEIGLAEGRSIANTLLTKIKSALEGTLSIEQINQIGLSCHVFPEDWHEQGPGSSASSTTYVDRGPDSYPKRSSLFVKKSVDIVGSLFALILFSPLLVAIAIAIKLTSRGPILFRQQRIGQSGRPFTFLKFRSMHSTNSHAIHEEYMKRLISGAAGAEQLSGNQSVYKLTGDPRITPVGRFLRQTSLDELPQFLNVLLGQMSLVGPRPPIPYEVEYYDIWHKRRLLVKPGITGLWQVKGRSRIKFAEMVRLDLEYARSWSIWLDIKILLQTPLAVLMNEGAL